MAATMIVYQGASVVDLDQVGEVLDPLAGEHPGKDPRTPRPITPRAWRRAFHAKAARAHAEPVRRRDLHPTTVAARGVAQQILRVSPP